MRGPSPPNKRKKRKKSREAHRARTFRACEPVLLKPPISHASWADTFVNYDNNGLLKT